MKRMTKWLAVAGLAVGLMLFVPTKSAMAADRDGGQHWNQNDNHRGGHDYDRGRDRDFRGDRDGHFGRPGFYAPRTYCPPPRYYSGWYRPSCRSGFFSIIFGW